MRFRGPLIGLSVSPVVALGLSWLVYATPTCEVGGPATSYSARLPDVYGLRKADDVRTAGVRVGRVEKIELVSKQTRVSFGGQSDQKLYSNTVATVTYQNIVGQRYLGLPRGKLGDTQVLAGGSTIPVERTNPAFDPDKLLNGLEHLFSALDPAQADKLTKGVIQSLQGDKASVTSLVDQTSTLTKTFAGRDQVLGNVVTSLNTAIGNLVARNDNVDTVLAQTQRAVADLDRRRPELVDSVSSLAQGLQRPSVIANDIDHSLSELISRRPSVTALMVQIEPRMAFLGSNLPLARKSLAGITGDSTYINACARDFNYIGFFSGLDDVIPNIVNAATPSIQTQNTPRYRNVANG